MINKTLVSDMDENKEYEIIASWDFSNELFLIRKDDSKVFVSFIGGEFDEPQTVYFNIDIVTNVPECEMFVIDELTIDDCMWIAVEVYNVVMSNNIPSELENKIGMIE